VFGPERNALLALVILTMVWTALANQYEAYLVSQQRSHTQAQLAGYDNALVISLSRRLVLLQALRAWTEAELATHGIIDQAEFEAVAGGLFETSTGNHAIWLVPNGIQSYVFPPNEPGAGVDLLHTDPPEKALDSLAALSTHELVVSLPEATPSCLELQARLAIYSQNHFWGLVTIAIDLPTAFTARPGRLKGPASTSCRTPPCCSTPRWWICSLRSRKSAQSWIRAR